MLYRFVSSPAVSGALLLIAWGPLWVTDVIGYFRPDIQNNTYKLQAFAIGWLPITGIATAVAIVVAGFHVIRFLVSRFRKTS